MRNIIFFLFNIFNALVISTDNPIKLKKEEYLRIKYVFPATSEIFQSEHIHPINYYDGIIIYTFNIHLFIFKNNFLFKNRFLFMTHPRNTFDYMVYNTNSMY